MSKLTQVSIEAVSLLLEVTADLSFETSIRASLRVSLRFGSVGGLWRGSGNQSELVNKEKDRLELTLFC